MEFLIMDTDTKIALIKLLRQAISMPSAHCGLTGAKAAIEHPGEALAYLCAGGQLDDFRPGIGALNKFAQEFPWLAGETIQNAIMRDIARKDIVLLLHGLGLKFGWRTIIK